MLVFSTDQKQTFVLTFSFHGIRFWRLHFTASTVRYLPSHSSLNRTIPSVPQSPACLGISVLPSGRLPSSIFYGQMVIRLIQGCMQTRPLTSHLSEGQVKRKASTAARIHTWMNVE